VIQIGALFFSQWASLVEMKYLWSTPHALANEKLQALIGPEPHTPLGHAVQTALADLHMLTISQTGQSAQAATA
jgi:hypothetical protein